MTVILYIISGLIIVACVLLILVVLVQNSKGGGLASNFSSNNQIMGVRKTSDFLEKATWTLAISLLVLSMVIMIPMYVIHGQRVAGKNSEVLDKANTLSTPYQAPANQPTETQKQ